VGLSLNIILTKRKPTQAALLRDLLPEASEEEATISLRLEEELKKDLTNTSKNCLLFK